MSQHSSKHTTDAGYRNRHGQTVLCDTGVPGTDYGQRVYLLQCNVCGSIYGSNGSDVFERKCPDHQEGAPGVAADLSHIEISRANLETVCYQPGHVYRDSAASTKKADDEFLRWFDAGGHSTSSNLPAEWSWEINFPRMWQRAFWRSIASGADRWTGRVMAGVGMWKSA